MENVPEKYCNDDFPSNSSYSSDKGQQLSKFNVRYAITHCTVRLLQRIQTELLSYTMLPSVSASGLLQMGCDPTAFTAAVTVARVWLFRARQTTRGLQHVPLSDVLSQEMLLQSSL